MKILFNTQTNQLANSQQFKDGYPHYLPDHIIQLEVINNPMPEIDNNTHKATMTPYKREGDTWVNGWVVEPLTEYELAVRDWKFIEYKFRIRVPRALGEAYPGLYAHFQLNRLPIEDYTDDIVDVYINTILGHHSDLLEVLQNVVEVHARPAILEPIS
jgi:hypothetical protein